MPKDELDRDGVLARVELDLLRAHPRGRDTSEGPMLFERVRSSEQEALAGGARRR